MEQLQRGDAASENWSPKRDTEFDDFGGSQLGTDDEYVLDHSLNVSMPYSIASRPQKGD